MKPRVGMVKFRRLCSMGYMRDIMESILKGELRVLALQTRDNLGITQSRMAELLEMSETSYSDIETGVYMCGTLTAILLLMQQNNPCEFLDQLKKRFEKLNEEVIIPI